MYFKLVEQICKTKKIRKTFVELLNFCMGRCWIRSCRFSQRFQRFQNTNLQSHWLSESSQTCIPMRLQIRVLKSI